MFDIGFFELIVVGVVALFVVGPERMPGLVRGAGFWLGKIRHQVQNVNDEMKRELHNADVLMREAEEKSRQSLLLEEEKTPPAEQDATLTSKLDTTVTSEQEPDKKS